MNGTGTASGAMTFLNALFTGIGSAAGLDLTASATVELRPAANRSFTVDAASDTPLVRAILGAALDLWAPGELFEVRTSVRSQIPAARGLKSSSAVSGAIAFAVASALGRPTSPEEVARLSAAVSRAIGLSATGAFDDALAGVMPGIHVTDNVGRRGLRVDPVDPDWRVVLLVPELAHRPSPEYVEQFRALAAEARPAEAAALEGRPLVAMAMNTQLVERALGLDLTALHRRLREAGALASGVSGLGPAVAAIAPSGHAAAVRAAFAPEEGEVVEVGFTQPAPRGSEGTP